MKNKSVSVDRLLYLKAQKREKIIVGVGRTLILVFLLAFWEIAAVTGFIDGFITSYPSEIAVTVYNLFATGNLTYHIGVTLWETFAGFVISVVLGYGVALLMWLSDRFGKIIDPYVVVLNSLPKIALGPILIVWFGVGEKAIIAMAVLISVIVCILTMLGGFLAIDKEKILLLKSFGANKFQIMTKLVIPGTVETFVSMLKIALGMSWIGSIMGEYLTSKAGLGYLIVYGSQVFKLDLVMASTVVLLVLSGGMYAVITFLSKLIVKYRK
ncbi:MAG: ABC transporter permease [Clostridia bacterium]|nr:ABC transporter permease [Clostridia bacterium]